LRQADGRFHRRLTLFAPAAQSRRSARHFAAAQPFPLPQAGRYLLFAGGIGITPLLAMAEAIAARKGRWSCIIMSPARARPPSPRA
jgi:ferredoxin-NADP reductase